MGCLKKLLCIVRKWWKYLPNAANIPAAQNTSPHSAGRNNNPPIRSPNESCNGSNIVIYPWRLIGFAKNIPPFVEINFSFFFLFDQKFFYFHTYRKLNWVHIQMVLDTIPIQMCRLLLRYHWCNHRQPMLLWIFWNKVSLWMLVGILNN